MVAESKEGFNTGHPVCPCCGLCKIRFVVVKLDRKNVQFHANPALQQIDEGPDNVLQKQNKNSHKSTEIELLKLEFLCFGG